MTRIIAATLAASMGSGICYAPPNLPHKHEAALRRQKVSCVWRSINPQTFSRQRSDFLADELQRADLGDQWFYMMSNWSYASNFNPAMVCNGGGMCARGIGDATEHHLSRAVCLRRFGTYSLNDALCGMANDIEQARQMHEAAGLDGWTLRRRVFLPSRMNSLRAYREQLHWEREGRRIRRIVAAGYASGAIRGETDNQRRGAANR